MKKLLTVVAVAEALTGLIVIAVPQVAAQLLFGAGVVGAGVAMSRIVGILLVAIGVACWPGPALVGMLTYGAGVTLYLIYIGLFEGITGVLLWPAVVLHVVLTALLARALSSNREATKTGGVSA